MKELSLREVQLISLELLTEIYDFCMRNDLHFVLGGGTLLGAVRHHGFIPWDDDIDINFLRADYEKLLKLGCALNTDSRALVSVKDGSFDRDFARYIRKDYVKKEEGFEDSDCPWVGIDIFPIDEVPSNDFLFKLQVKSLWILRKILLLTVTNNHSGKTELKRLIKNIIRPIAKLIGSHRLAVLMDKICKYYNGKEGIYVAALTGMYGEREKWLKEKYMPVCEVQFEDLFFPANMNYDEYLSNLYGNYMELPPEKKRKYTSAKVYSLF